jgi:hypothetical protein
MILPHLRNHRKPILSKYQSTATGREQARTSKKQVEGYFGEDCADAFELRFADNGPGIPRAVGQRIFEPQLSRKEGGRGMGLTIGSGIGDITSSFSQKMTVLGPSNKTEACRTCPCVATSRDGRLCGFRCTYSGSRSAHGTYSCRRPFAGNGFKATPCRKPTAAKKKAPRQPDRVSPPVGCGTSLEDSASSQGPSAHHGGGSHTYLSGSMHSGPSFRTLFTNVETG